MTTIPILLDLGIFKVYTTGVFLVLGLFWALFVFWKSLKLTHHKEEQFFDIILLSGFIAFIFSRIFYVILHFDQFGFDILKIILVNGYPGLSLLGAFIGAFLVLIIFCWVMRLSIGETMDYVLPAVLLFFATGKAGSFLAGVDVGTVTKLPIAMKYLGHDGWRHPVAAYEGIFLMIGYLVVYKLLLAVRRGDWSLGSTYAIGAAWIGADLFLFDKLKVQKLYLAGFSLNLWVGFFILVVALSYFIFMNSTQLKGNMEQLIIKFKKKK